MAYVDSRRADSGAVGVCISEVVRYMNKQQRHALFTAFDEFLAVQGLSPDEFLDAWRQQLLQDAEDYTGPESREIRELLRASGKQLQGASMDWYASTK